MSAPLDYAASTERLNEAVEVVNDATSTGVEGVLSFIVAGLGVDGEAFIDLVRGQSFLGPDSTPAWLAGIQFGWTLARLRDADDLLEEWER